MPQSLGFKFVDGLPWQERAIASTLGCIVKKFEERLTSPHERGLEFCVAIAIEYVHQSNVGESVGTQTLGETRGVLEERAASGETNLSEEQRVSVNTYQALSHVEKLIQEMDGSGLLTVQVVCDIHAIVLNRLHHTAGKIRSCDVYTILEDGRQHTYPPPSGLEDRFYYIIDKHNIHMEALSRDRFCNPREKVEYAFKCAAWLLFHLVSLHPFADGNGRTCRLLASYVLSSIVTPFPVSVCHNNLRSCRTDYIRAIVRCRENPEEGPAELASLLVEGAHLGWDHFESKIRNN